LRAAHAAFAQDTVGGALLRSFEVALLSIFSLKSVEFVARENVSYRGTLCGQVGGHWDCREVQPPKFKKSKKKKEKEEKRENRGATCMICVACAALGWNKLMRDTIVQYSPSLRRGALELLQFWGKLVVATVHIKRVHGTRLSKLFPSKTRET